MEQGRYGVGPVQTDTEDYTQDVSAIIEQGTAYNGILPSFTEWRKDAFLMYSKPSVSLEEIMGMTRTDGMHRAGLDQEDIAAMDFHLLEILLHRVVLE